MRAAASTTATPWRRPGDRVIRSMGPLTLTAATTRPVGSATGALTDATPGLLSPVWFTPTLAGRFDIACSQLCGLAHYRMKAFYTIDTPEQYQARLLEEAATLPPQ